MENTILSLQNKLKIHKAIIYVLSGFLLAMVFFIIFDNKTSQNANKGVNIKSIDTVVVRDTLKIEIPVEKIKYRDRKVVDTLYLPTPQDTTPLPIEQKHYQDSISDIYISGYQPQIDSIQYHIPYKTVYVDKVVEVEKTKSFWEDRFIFTVGVYGGYGIISKQPDIFIGAGVGIRLGK